MPATDQHLRRADNAERRAADNDVRRAAEDEHLDAEYPGVDPGEMDTWEIIRVHCPECDRPIALVGDEERLPQHAVLPTAWHPFSPALCPGSGEPADELPECDSPDHSTGPGLEALLALPAALDWRTQPFSHAGGPGSVPAQLSRGVVGSASR